MHKGSLCVHEVKLVIKPGPSLHDSSGVGQTTNCPVDLGQISTWYYSWRLVVDTNLQKELYLVEDIVTVTPTLNPVGHQSTNWILF